MHPGLIGGIIGAIIGVAGGIIGSWATVKNASGPREKSFVVRAVTFSWILVLIFIGLLILLPRPWNFLMWVPYGIILPLGIIKWNKMQQAIIAEEKIESDDNPQDEHIVENDVT